MPSLQACLEIIRADTGCMCRVYWRPPTMSSQRKTTLRSNLIPKCRFGSNKLHTSGLLRVYPLLGKASCTVSGAHMSAQPGTKCKCQVLGHEHGMEQEEEDSFSTESKEECSPFVLTHSSFESKAKPRTEKDEEIKCLFLSHQRCLQASQC